MYIIYVLHEIFVKANIKKTTLFMTFNLMAKVRLKIFNSNVNILNKKKQYKQMLEEL